MDLTEWISIAVIVTAAVVGIVAWSGGAYKAMKKHKTLKGKLDALLTYIRSNPKADVNVIQDIGDIISAADPALKSSVDTVIKELFALIARQPQPASKPTQPQPASVPSGGVKPVDTAQGKA